MSLTEQAGKVANSVVDTLKSQPLALALIVLNVLYLGVMFWIWQETSTRRAEMVTNVLKSCLDLEEKRGFTWSPAPEGRGSGGGMAPGFK